MEGEMTEEPTQQRSQRELDQELDEELENTFPASDALKITRRQPDIHDTCGQRREEQVEAESNLGSEDR
jgi:hypothetical protein